MLRRLALVIGVIWLSSPLVANPYPASTDGAVTDIADVLTPDAELRLNALLDSLRRDTGIEAAVVTLPTRKDYPPVVPLEAFATRLFNGWGIGDPARNDGILLLVLPDDRETRIELGAGYDQGYDVLAQDIVSRWLVPAFREGDYGTGIETGMRAVAERIARRHAARLAPEPLPARPEGRAIASWLFGIGFAAIAGFALFGRKIGDLVAGLKRCPACGQRRLHRSRATIVHAGPGTPGTARILTECRNCDHREEREERIGAGSRQGSGGGFSGGRSSGGGASGRW